MKLNDWLDKATNYLSEIPTARLDCLILLEDATGHDRGWLLAHPEFELETKIATKLQKQLKQRAQHVPLAYIRGKSEFYGREFMVTSATLQPRPETETIIDLLKQLKDPGLRAQGSVFVDVGTGSGCLAITAKLEFPDAQVFATEINEDALKIAKQNARKLAADITFYRGNLFKPLAENRELRTENLVLICNLPYVPNSHTINEAAMQEPKVAIFGGEDGLDLYREMFDQINESSGKPKYILTESLPFQHKELAAIAQTTGYKQIKEADFIQLFSLERQSQGTTASQ